jgi:hypothetical protein
LVIRLFMFLLPASNPNSVLQLKTTFVEISHYYGVPRAG